MALEKCLTLGKLRQTWKNAPHLEKSVISQKNAAQLVK